jgi:hypothetical protein
MILRSIEGLLNYNNYLEFTKDKIFKRKIILIACFL